MEGMKGAEWPGATGTGTAGTGKACFGGVSVLAIAAGCWARTDLDTSSSQRSASDGVRLWQDPGAERIALTAGRAPTEVEALGHSPPIGQIKKITFPDFSLQALS